LNARLLTGLLAALAALSLLACSGSESTPEPTAVLEATPTQVPRSATPAPPTNTPMPPASTPVPTQTPIPPGDGSPARVITRGPTTSRTVALTFDAGSDRGFVAQILDTLASEGVVASFGLTGVWAERNPDIVARIANDGHAIINHSYSHASFTGNSTDGRPLTQAQRFAELDRAEAVIAGITGRSTKPLFRSPYGDYDASTNRDVGARGYAFNVLWTVDSRGWLGIPASEITAHCLRMAIPGAIYVFHVGSASQDGPALPAIIAGLREAGYSFVSVLDYAR
jgi:peptidoglycan/xylan/chitin deacetylase (PgdA/CDA1 family)